MGNKSKVMDLGGLDIHALSVSVGHTKPGLDAGSSVFSGDAPLSLTLDNSADSPAAYVDVEMTASGAANDIDGSKFVLTTAVALGNYANAINGKIDFGSAGRVTGLGGAICAEIDLGAGCSQGSYAPFEAEIVMPSGALTGTRTSFITMNLSGAAASTFDTNGFVFDLNGLTAGSGKTLQTGNTFATPAATLKVKVGSTTYYLPLYDGQITTV